MFFWMFFCPMVLASWKSCSYSLNLPTYQLTNFQITVEDALHASLCMEEHTWEITESSEFYITFNINIRIGVAKVYLMTETSGNQFTSPWSQMPTEVSAQQPEQWNVPPFCTLTHSLKHFWTSIFEFREVQTFINRPFVVSPHSATPLNSG